MEVLPIGTKQIQYQGVLDDQKFYNFFKDTLEGLGYSVVENSYVQFGGNNFNIKWTARKVVDDYMAYRLTIIIDYLGLTDANAVSDGKPVKVKTGTVNVKMVADVLLDYMNKWTVGVSKLVRPVYDKMNQDLITQRKNSFEAEVQDIKSTLQSHLG
ncbi:MAG: hypothetical protein M1573_01345 [Candidatus Parvarchaeota archaeon]|jgi:hypothetical protein|nr:hypothetical protein [Candidatus Parvarchaeota archaeon]MCL5017868.1 hypothetical protein [Candidatus Parvarchaeota archaeon]